jgi:hypothetical protein
MKHNAAGLNRFFCPSFQHIIKDSPHLHQTMASATEPYSPFSNVRVGGPKEKRIRRVELMGEHKPKPVFYIKASQSLDDDFLSEEVLRNFFETR